VAFSALKSGLMAVLASSKHEQFALLVVKGVSATKAYTLAGYSSKGARQSAARMLTNADIQARIREPQEAVSAEVITLEISSRNCRIRALQKRWDRLRDALDRILDQRGADMVDVPGGDTGMLARDYKGKESDTAVYRIDPGIVGLASELSGHEKQAAVELQQWRSHIEEHKTVEITPEAYELALLCTPEQWPR
jgi:hypothetical protein